MRRLFYLIFYIQWMQEKKPLVRILRPLPHPGVYHWMTVNKTMIYRDGLAVNTKKKHKRTHISQQNKIYFSQ